MIQQEITDIDFDTYFDVSSNSVQQQQQQQQQMIYNQNHDSTLQPIHPTQQLNTSRNLQQQPQYFVPSQRSHRPPQQPPYDMLNWCFKEQPNQLNNLMQNEQSSSSRSDYLQSTATQAPINASQQQYRTSMKNKEEGMQYRYQNNNMMSYQLSNETNSVGAGSSNTSKAGLPTPVSDVIFPETPQSRTSAQSAGSNFSNTASPDSVSPTSESPTPLINPFTAIEQWRKSNEDEAVPDCANEDYHVTRNWRKTNRSDSITSHTTNLVASAMAVVAARTAARTPIETGRQLKKVAHNAIERRYRNNINDRISDLKSVVPALYKAKIREKKNKSGSDESSDDENEDGAGAGDGEIVEGVQVAKKLNKATILHKATEYIHHLKHTNELAERENLVLQQILAQMPGGTKVLARFQDQKCDYQQAEQQRLLAERKDAMERERNERQRILRERAAQRAALAELLPKQERRPYRRRVKKQQTEGQDTSNSDVTMRAGPSLSPQNNASSSEQDIQSEDSNATTTNTSNNRTFMALFLCLAVASPSSFGRNGTGSHTFSARVIPHSQQIMAQTLSSTVSIDYWYWSKIILFIALSVYVLLRYINGKTLASNQKA